MRSVRQINRSSLVMPIGDRSLQVLNATFTQLAHTLSLPDVSSNHIKQSLSLVTCLKDTQLSHHHFLSSLDAAMTRVQEHLSPYHVISTFYAMSHIMYTPSFHFQRMLIDHVHQLAESFDYTIHLRHPIDGAVDPIGHTKYPLSSDPYLNPQDMLMQVVIGYGMMPADKKDDIQGALGTDFPLSLAINGLHTIIERYCYGETNVMRYDLFSDRYMQLGYWALRVESHENNQIAYVAEIADFIHRIKHKWKPALMESRTECIILDQLQRDRAFSDSYKITSNIVHKKLLTEIDFVISDKSNPKNAVFYEIDGPHHFIRHLDHPLNYAPYTHGNALPIMANGQTLLKTKILLTKGSVIRMPTFGARFDYFHRIHKMPERIGHFLRLNPDRLLVIDPQHYSETDYMSLVIRKKSAVSLPQTDQKTTREAHRPI